MSRGYCAACCAMRELVSVDELGRPCCVNCVSDSEVFYLDRAMSLLQRVPICCGDQVEARTAGVLLDGEGAVCDIDITFEHGGTPVHPMFHVVLGSKAHDAAPDDGWYPASCLTRVEQKAGSDV